MIWNKEFLSKAHSQYKPQNMETLAYVYLVFELALNSTCMYTIFFKNQGNKVAITVKVT